MVFHSEILLFKKVSLEYNLNNVVLISIVLQSESLSFL